MAHADVYVINDNRKTWATCNKTSDILELHQKIKLTFACLNDPREIFDRKKQDLKVTDGSSGRKYATFTFSFSKQLRHDCLKTRLFMQNSTFSFLLKSINEIKTFLR